MRAAPPIGPQFAPGEIQIYNVSGFRLLGPVVEKASGMSYACPAPTFVLAKR